jgi:hypothetical protein
MLEALFLGMVKGEVSTPQTLSGGARLYWSVRRREMLIARPNKRLPLEELKVFRRYIRDAGLEIKGEREAQISEGINDYYGYALRLEIAPEPAPQAEQLTLL